MILPMKAGSDDEDTWQWRVTNNNGDNAGNLLAMYVSRFREYSNVTYRWTIFIAMKISLASSKPTWRENRFSTCFFIVSNTSDVHVSESCKKSHRFESLKAEAAVNCTRAQRKRDKSPFQTKLQNTQESSESFEFCKRWPIHGCVCKICTRLGSRLYKTACTKRMRLYSLKQYVASFKLYRTWLVQNVQMDNTYKIYKTYRTWRNPARRSRIASNETYIYARKTYTSRTHSVGQFYFRARYETYETKLRYQTWVEFLSIHRPDLIPSLTGSGTDTLYTTPALTLYTKDGGSTCPLPLSTIIVVRRRSCGAIEFSSPRRQALNIHTRPNPQYLAHVPRWLVPPCVNV